MVHNCVQWINNVKGKCKLWNVVKDMKRMNIMAGEEKKNYYQIKKTNKKQIKIWENNTEWDQDPTSKVI